MARSAQVPSVEAPWPRVRRRARKRAQTVRRLSFETLEGRLVLADPGVGGGAVTAAVANVTVTFTVPNDWGSGFTGNIAIKNTGSSAVQGWVLEFDFARNINSIWNASVVSRQGDHYVLKDAGYNATIAPGATVTFGFNGSAGNLGTLKPTNYVFNGAMVGGGTPGPLPTLTIGDASATEGDPVTGGSGFLRTAGNQIVDAQGQPVRIAGVNWFGLETTNYAPHGLWTRNYKDMMDQMKELGFNTIRLPYSNQLFDAGSTPNGIDFNKNPDLQGLSGLQIIDKIVDYAGAIGLRIILDHHRSTAGNSAQESGLWYTSAYPESRWISDWVMLATRYQGNATVIGADLHNEPHGPATWGSGDTASDWRLAAERAGNAVLAANPDWLVLVEGIETTQSGSTWWGGNLSNAGAFPVRLDVAGRLVYAPHEYPQSIYDQAWFSDPNYPNNLPAIWDKNWGYLFRQGTAPILIGEFGSKLATTSDTQWMDKLIGYLEGDLDGNGTNDLQAGQLGASWTYWSWNPNSSDTGGILKDDWNSVHTNKVDLLAPVQFALAAPSDGATTITFTVGLSTASSTTVTVNYTTADGTATAGTDYLAQSGSLTFAPGETSKTIRVALIGDTVNEANETFRAQLSGASNATIADGDGTGTIVNDDAPAAPKLSISDAAIVEGNSGSKSMTFTVTLSAAATSTVTVNYATANATANAGSDYVATSGALTFAAGQTSKTFTVTALGDTTYEPDEQFVVNLTNASGATIQDGQGTGTIQNDDAAPPPLPSLSINDVTVAEGQSGTTSATFTVTLSAAATSTVTVNYATAGDTATAGTDFTAASGSLTFAAGETSKTIVVAVQGDTTVEPNERFMVALSGASGATIGTGTGEGTILNDDTSSAPAYNYGEAVQKAIFFYEAQRSGDLPSNYIVDWRGDTALNDGQDVGVDLSGGYWDAGDHVKFGLPMASSMTLLAWSVVQYGDAYANSGQLDRILETIKWGTDYIVKAHTAPNEFYGQVGRGDLDHAYWGAPEVMTMARPSYKIDAQHPGSDLAGEAAAALAAAALAFRNTGPDYAALLIRHAEELYSFADTYRGKYSDSIPDAAGYYNSYSGYMDELVWGAMWLYKATGKTSYLDKAETYYAQNFAGQTMTWTHSWDDKRYGSVILLAQATGKTVYQTDAERWLDYWSVGTNGGTTRIAYTDGGLAWLTGWGSLRYASTTAFLAFVYGDTVRDHSGRYHDFAVSQINYILGDNPRNASYMVGFGNNFPKNPHHRAASGVWDGNVGNPAPNRHILYGALVGGPESADDFDYHDDRTNYISNEVALDYNAGFTGALARMYLEYGGAPLASFPIAEPRTDEFFVQASLNQEGATYTEVRGLLNNRSAWPARMSSSLSFRYFVDLSEVYQAGHTVNDVEVASYYSQGATISGLLPWDAARRIYYVEVSFAGVSIGPVAGGYFKEAQVRIGLKNGLPASAWDPTNDWSYQGLRAGRDALTTTANIPVYEFGTTRLFGEVPGAAAPGTPSLTIENVSITEGNGGTKTATFNVRLSQPSSSVVTVSYGTADGTARAGSDYTAASGTLTFAAGTTLRTISVPIVGDTVAEGNEAFQVRLSNAVNAALGTAQATGTIVDDDAPASGIAVAYTVSDDWGSGFVASVTITNNTASAITDWVIEFDLAANLSSIWNARIVKRVGNRYTIRAASWNMRIEPGQSVTFGFQGDPGNVSRSLGNVVVNGVRV